MPYICHIYITQGARPRPRPRLSLSLSVAEPFMPYIGVGVTSWITKFYQGVCLQSVSSRLRRLDRIDRYIVNEQSNDNSICIDIFLFINYNTII